jgi:3-hydroxybutyryl-CoA dehydratase
MCIRTSCTFTVTEEKIKQYTLLSGDDNQIHLEQEIAQQSGYKAPIAHGMLTMGLAYDIVSLFIENGMRVKMYEMQFIKPIYWNDTILVTAEKRFDSNRIYLELVGWNKNELVIKGELIMEE